MNARRCFAAASLPSGPAARPRRRRTRRVEGVISRGARGVRDRRRGDRRASPRPRDPRASPVTRRSGTRPTARARRGISGAAGEGTIASTAAAAAACARPVAKTRREEREERRERPCARQGRRSRRRESTVGQQQRIRRYPRTIAHHVLAVRPACAPATARGRLGAARRRRAHETRAISPRVKHARVWIRGRAGTVQTAGETLVHHLRLYPMKRLRARRRRHRRARRRGARGGAPNADVHAAPWTWRTTAVAPTFASTRPSRRPEPSSLDPSVSPPRALRIMSPAHASNTAAMGGGRARRRITSNPSGRGDAVRRSRRFAPTSATDASSPGAPAATRPPGASNHRRQRRDFSQHPRRRAGRPRVGCTAATDPPPRV